MLRVLELALSLFVLSVLVGGTCQMRPPPFPVEPDDTSECAAACKNLGALGCPEGEPLEDGTTCTEFCERTQEAGHPLNPTCVKSLTECSQIETCTNR